MGVIKVNEVDYLFYHLFLPKWFELRFKPKFCCLATGHQGRKGHLHTDICGVREWPKGRALNLNAGLSSVLVVKGT